MERNNGITMPRLAPIKFLNFINSLSSGRLCSILDDIGIGKTAGDWPTNCVDCVHDDDGGDDKLGLRPQRGIEILRAEIDAPTFKNGIAEAKDDISGCSLPPELVRAARGEEMDFFKRLSVYEIVHRSHQKATGGKVIGTRWVDTNKGDTDSPDLRSRLVGREFNVGKDDTLYAAAPPLEALRLILNPCGNLDRKGGRRAVHGHDQ